MVGFKAGPAPKTELARHVEDELERVAINLETIDNLTLVELNAEPVKPRTGMVALADGTNWNPGSGAGFYGYTGAVWGLLSGTSSLHVTRNGISSTQILSAVSIIETIGYAAAGDGGGARYKRVGSEPSHDLKVQSADSAWWEIVPDQVGINVRQAGAKGDGTTDDSVAFQSCVDSTFDLVFVPDGIYRVHRVNIKRSVHIKGVGKESEIKHFDNGQTYDATYMSFEPEASGITLEDLNFVGSLRTSGVNTFPYYHIRMQDQGSGGSEAGFSDFRVINCRFFAGLYQLKMEETRRQFISGCEFIQWDRTDSGDYGGGLLSRAGNGQWLNNYADANTQESTISAVGGDAYKIAIDADYATGPFVIDGNIGMRAHRDGLDINCASGRNIVVSNNIFENNLGPGIDLKKGAASNLSNDAATMRDIIVTGNHISADVNDRSLMNVQNNSGTYERVSITGNMFTYVIPSATESLEVYACVGLSGVDDVLINGNTFINADIGVKVDDNSLSAIISENHFEDCNTGVFTSADANQNLRILNNTFKVANAALDLNGSTGVLFMGNYVDLVTSEGAARYAVQVGNPSTTCANVDICHNYIQVDDVSVCVRPIDIVTGLRIYGNTLKCNNNNAIHTTSSFSAGLVFDNIISINTDDLTVTGSGGVDGAWNNLHGSSTARPTRSAFKGDVVKNSAPNTLPIEGWKYDGTNWVEYGQISGANVGTVGTGTTAVEYGDGYSHITVLTMAGTLPAIAGGAALAVGLKVYTFPAGVTRVKSVHMDVGITQSQGNINADTPLVGVGSVIATGSFSVLNGTTGFDDYVTEKAAANCTGTVTDFSFDNVTAALQLNIAGGEKKLHLNVADNWAASGDSAATLSGTITIEWSYLGA